MIKDIPEMELICNSPSTPSNARPTRNGGSKNGTKVKAETSLAILGDKDLSQLPNGTPKMTANNELTNAINAVVASSSRLVVKDVRPVGQPTLSVCSEIQFLTNDTFSWCGELLEFGRKRNVRVWIYKHVPWQSLLETFGE